MPWKECLAMDERLQVVARQLAGEPMTELSQPTQKGQRFPYPGRPRIEPHPRPAGSPVPSASAPPGLHRGHLHRAPVAPSKAAMPK
jgi:hypothetical protein